jgi:hypothetical protein
MDLRDIKTTDDLLLILPPTETNEWEFKAAKKLTDSDFDAELGKQVSAFANTGGGNLVFGISDKTRDIELCIKKIGRQSTVDWLTTKVQNSVAYSLQDFRIYEIAITGDSSNSIFVVEIGDSQAAPHQAKATSPPLYYWRLFGKSEPAPHFHLDLLRHRLTRTILDIDRVISSLYAERFQVLQENVVESRDGSKLRLTQMVSELRLDLDITVKNTSMSSAESWGILYASVSDLATWYCQHEPVMLGGCLRGTHPLLPEEVTTVRLRLSNTTNTHTDVTAHNSEIRTHLSMLSLKLRPASHNHIGEEFRWEPGKSVDGEQLLMADLMQDLASRGNPISP